jgi:hypothetical protein
MPPPTPRGSSTTSASTLVTLGSRRPVSDVDRAALTGEFADAMARLMRRGVSAGIAGWLDDDLAFAKPWGFDVGAIATPVSI